MRRETVKKTGDRKTIERQTDERGRETEARETGDMRQDTGTQRDG